MALSGKAVKFVYLLTGTQPADPQEDTIYFSHDGKCIYVGDEKMADLSPSFSDIEDYVDRAIDENLGPAVEAAVGPAVEEAIEPLQSTVDALSTDMYGWQDEDPSGIVYDLKQEIANTPKWIVVDSNSNG